MCVLFSTYDVLVCKTEQLFGSNSNFFTVSMLSPAVHCYQRVSPTALEATKTTSLGNHCLLAYQI